MNLEKTWRISSKLLFDTNKKPIMMGILNCTPDSFSDGGKYNSIEQAYKKACRLIDDGAHIIDIGGESTRPGASIVDPASEQVRILEVIKKLAQDKKCLISVDTYKSTTAMLALESGANIINDVCGLHNSDMMAEIIASFSAAVIIMHTNRGRVSKDDIVEDVKYFFDKAINKAIIAGISDQYIALDPGFGFGKDPQTNMELFRRIDELDSFTYPFVAATSRKGFLGKITGVNKPSDRDPATVATSVMLRNKGFSIFRVHDVVSNKQALDIYDELK